MRVGATDTLKKNYSILFNVITFTFRSRYHIRAHCNSVILQPWRSHHQRLAFELEVKWQKFQKNLCRMQLSPTVATSASTRAQTLLISRGTCGNIPEKSLSSATNVASLPHKLATSGDTCWLIRVRSLSGAINVASLAQKLVISRDTCWLIRVRSHSAVHNATTLAH